MSAKLLTRLASAAALGLVTAVAVGAQGPGPVPRANLSPEDRALRDRRIEEQLEFFGAGEIAILDRTGRTVATLGERAFYNGPVLSPDKAKLVVSQFDPETEIAWPSIFVVAKDGKIVHRWLADTFSERVATDEVLKALP